MLARIPAAAPTVMITDRSGVRVVQGPGDQPEALQSRTSALSSVSIAITACTEPA